MFDWLKTILDGLWGHLLPFTVIHQYERGGVFRLGLYNRTLEPGFHWRWPLAEQIVTEHTVTTTLALEPQTITTKDNKSVVVSGIVRYRIVNVQSFVCEISSPHDVLRDTSMGSVLKQTRQIELRTLLDEPPESKIASDIRRQVKEFGIEIDSFTFIDIGQIRTLRLITHTHALPGV
jgi:membrane protease subunit HflK